MTDSHDSRCFDWHRESPDGITRPVAGTIEVYPDGALLVRPEGASTLVGRIGVEQARKLASKILQGPHPSIDVYEVVKAEFARAASERDAAVSALEAEKKAHSEDCDSLTGQCDKYWKEISDLKMVLEVERADRKRSGMESATAFLNTAEAFAKELAAEREGHRVTRAGWKSACAERDILLALPAQQIIKRLGSELARVKDNASHLEAELAEAQSLLGVSASRRAIFEGERDAALARVSELERELAKANETIRGLVKQTEAEAAVIEAAIEYVGPQGADASTLDSAVEKLLVARGSALPAAPGAQPVAGEGLTPDEWAHLQEMLAEPPKVLPGLLAALKSRRTLEPSAQPTPPPSDDKRVELSTAVMPGAHGSPKPSTTPIDEPAPGSRVLGYEPASEPEAQRAVVVGSKWTGTDGLERVVTGIDRGVSYVRTYDETHHWEDTGAFARNFTWVSNPPSETTGEKL